MGSETGCESLLSPFLCFAVLAVLVIDAAAQGAPTRWDHNGSEVSLSSNGDRRQFHYQAPAADLIELGVKPGTLLFEGRKDGARYSGTAYVFSKSCGPQKYAVSGPVSPDQRTVTMTGRAPQVNPDCRVVEYRDDVLVFTFSPPVEVPANQGYAEQNGAQQSQQRAPAYDTETEGFLQQWKSCFDAEQSTALAIEDCDTALSFPRLRADDRANLLRRRAALAQLQELFGQKPIVNAIAAPNKSVETQQQAIAVSSGKVESTPFNIFESILGPIIWVLISVFAVGFIVTLRTAPASKAPLPAGEVATQNTAEPSKSSSRNLFSKIADAVQRALTAETLPVTYSSYEPPSAPISLKVTRSERYTIMGKLMFVLDARMGLNAEDHRLVRKYRLGDQIMYDSRSRKKYAEKTKAHLELTRDQVPLSAGFTAQLFGLGKTVYRVGRAWASAIMTGSSLRVTVDSLIRGAHLECDSMGELLAAENAIVEASRNLKTYLKEATTFDGREHIIEL